MFVVNGRREMYNVGKFGLMFAEYDEDVGEWVLCFKECPESECWFVAGRFRSKEELHKAFDKVINGILNDEKVVMIYGG